MIFYFSKLLWVLAQPSNLAVAILSLGIILTWTRWARAGRRMTTVIMVFLIAIAFLPMGNWLASPLENRFPQPKTLGKVDGIIVVGGAFSARVSADREISALNSHAERYTKFVELARAFPEARLIVSGGAVWPLPNGATEQTFSRQFFREQGLDPDLVVYQDTGRNTHEDIFFLRNILNPGQDERWVVITSAAHMPRVIGLARRAGFDFTPYPVDYATTRTLDLWRPPSVSVHLESFDAAIREWVGLAAYFLLGRTSTLFPAPDRS